MHTANPLSTAKMTLLFTSLLFIYYFYKGNKVAILAMQTLK